MTWRNTHCPQCKKKIRIFAFTWTGTPIQVRPFVQGQTAYCTSDCYDDYQTALLARLEETS